MVLSWFRKRPAGPSYQVWMHDAAKKAGILEAIHKAQDSGAKVIVVAHFTQTIADWTDLLDGSSLAWELVVSESVVGRLRERGAGAGKVYLLHADLIRGTGEFVADPGNDPRSFRIHVAESHCLADRYAPIQRLAEALGSAEVSFHVSFDEPMLKLFSGEKTKHMLRSLGMADDQCIEHRMVDRSILRAQEKLAEHVIGDAPAESQEDWMRQNCPGFFA